MTLIYNSYDTNWTCVIKLSNAVIDTVSKYGRVSVTVRLLLSSLIFVGKDIAH